MGRMSGMMGMEMGVGMLGDCTIYAIMYDSSTG